MAVYVGLATCCALAQIQNPSNRYRDKLEPHLKSALTRQEVPGFSIAVVEGSRIVYEAGFGTLEVGQARTVTPQSAYHMASVTKPFVATAIMQLVEARKMNLDSPLVAYLPRFRMADPRYRYITIRQMLTHCSGIPDVVDYEWDKPRYGNNALDLYAHSLSDMKLNFAPGERFEYSNLAYDILGDVIATVSGETFEGYISRHILQPLKMNDSTLLRPFGAQHLAWPHELNEQGSPTPAKVYPYNRIHSPSSNLHSTAHDMAQWAIANLNGGKLGTDRILNSSAYGQLWNPELRSDATVSPVALSWFIGKYRGYRLVWHDGGDTGFMTCIALLPEQKIGVVWMMNADWFPATTDLAHAALDTALGFDPEPIIGKRSIRQAMLAAYDKGGIGAAIREYEILYLKRPAEYDFEPRAVNNVGWYLLHFGHTKDAIAVFEFAVATFPSSAECFDALAGGYEKDGAVDLALRNYQKALILEPTNEHARGAVERLTK